MSVRSGVLGVGVVMHVLRLPVERCVVYVLLGASSGEGAGDGWGELDIRIRYQSNITAYTYKHEIPTMFTTHYSTQRHYGSHILRVFPPLVTVQNTICSSTRSCSSDDVHNDDRNMLR